jgi:hypothetical protein
LELFRLLRAAGYVFFIALDKTLRLVTFSGEPSGCQPR